MMKTHTGVVPMESLESELAQLMIDTLNLDMSVRDIDSQAPLIQDSLDLDSIDLLELSVVISRKYDIQIKSDDQDIHTLFLSLHALAKGVTSRRNLRTAPDEIPA